MGFAVPLILLFGPILVLSAMALSDKYRRPIRQFSIRDLLFYVFLWAVCFSQVSIFRNISHPNATPFEHFAWRDAWIILFAWMVLAVFYVRRRDFTSLVIHCLGVLFFGSLFALTLASGGRLEWDDDASRFLAGMFVGSFAGLVCFSMTTLLGMLRRVEPPPEKEEKE